MKKLLEKDIQKACKEYLEWRGWLVVKFPSVGIYNQKTGHYIPQSRRGVSDLLACSPTGQFAAFEIKRPGAKGSDEQSEFIKDVKRRGGIGGIVHSIDELEKLIKNL